ncbi:MAG: phospho-sugar mutase [Propionibacteriaceae bacterium]|jgi:phosphomannomutase|nr:phospho-sugar mutase [Propionibacteriaceae bacterium]
MIASDLARSAEEWIAHDPSETDRAELRSLVERADHDEAAAGELADRMSGDLQFGTAGLRGAMAAGPNRMNRAVVIRAARGLADYLLAAAPDWQGDRRPPRVVIGNDARHHSREFAVDSAAVMTAAGVEVLLLPDQVPTPVLAFSVRHLEADAGVMVTASHNPANDNGYKVYLGGRSVTDPERGAQIVPPYDGQIAACIKAAPPADEIDRAVSGWVDLGPELIEAYISAIVGAPGSPGETPEAPAAALKIVHTAMHGVGSPIALEALRRSGFTDITTVAAQEKPDPDFPTVAFPNPEEKGAIDLALAEAVRVGADIVIANDPDADRCAVAILDPRAGESGAWRMLHGDELGSLLGEAIASAESASRQSASSSSGDGGAGVIVNSVVSSRLLARIAAAHGLPYQRTLTGFKWMGRVPGMRYAYEEAIGYCVRPDLVHDKDGLSAAVEIARLAARLKAAGSTMSGQLDDLARRHGLHLTSQLAVRFASLDGITSTMRRLHDAPPSTLAGRPITSVVDLSEGYDGLPPTDGVALMTADDDRVIIRPSGTEPKVKCYLEVILPVAEDASFDDLTAIRRTARERLDAITEDLQANIFA